MYPAVCCKNDTSCALQYHGVQTMGQQTEQGSEGQGSPLTDVAIIICWATVLKRLDNYTHCQAMLPLRV